VGLNSLLPTNKFIGRPHFGARRYGGEFTQFWACGLNKIDHVIQVYGVPNEVVARMGPLARPNILPSKTMAAEVALPPMF
jgi:hypothetical protein